ncbi:MAG: threonine synthase [Phycisphaerales bacterium]
MGRGSFVTHLESAIEPGVTLPHTELQTTHAGRPLWVRYDYDAIGDAVSRSDIARRDPTLWRYRELLPVESDEHIVTLGEGMSPMLSAPRLAKKYGVGRVWIKDESQLPTGSFKSRGMTMAVSRAKELGAKRLAVPTAGNAGGALAAYAARAGLEAFVFMPDDTPEVNQYEASLYGARAFRVNALIDECGRLVREGRERLGWFDVSTLREPYRIEGKKTMGLELAEQLGWRLPDAIFYPTGGGTGLIGMWKAFAELATLGWLEEEKRPRLYACQSSGCCPIVRAFERGDRHAERFEDAKTIASGIRVPAAVGDFMILDAVRESEGAALATDEAEILPLMREASRLTGISICPEAAACVGALASLAAKGALADDAEVVIFNTGAAQKYLEAIATDLPRIDASKPVDWDAVVGAAG